ncbi:MAG: ParA family protein [Gammaproteobacteria bacterium]|nr:ParA family protein [Gammaproteobacteria bacterium]
MLKISVMNTKGGCGKTTVATNLASYCASMGYPTALFDYDKQASSMRWLKDRPSNRPAIHGVAAFEPPRPGTTRAWQMKVPPETRYIITDTPAGYGMVDIEDRVAEADVILIPVLPSSIDINSTVDFIRDLLLVGKARSHNTLLAIVTNRTRIRTRAVEKLERFLNKLDIPVIARIRDTQHYVSAAGSGLGIHELNERDAQKDRITWAELLYWLDNNRGGFIEFEYEQLQDLTA